MWAAVSVSAQIPNEVQVSAAMSAQIPNEVQMWATVSARIELNCQCLNSKLTNYEDRS